jgi:primosomal protein N' (replication factor Y)
VVQFGKSKLYTAIIAAISEHAPEKYEAKYIIEILDDAPVVTQRQLQFWHWLAEYYMCNEGRGDERGPSIGPETGQRNQGDAEPGVEYDKTQLNDKEYLITEALDIQPELTVSDIVKLLGQKTVMPILKSLFEKNIITYI